MGSNTVNNNNYDACRFVRQALTKALAQLREDMTSMAEQQIKVRNTLGVIHIYKSL